MEVRKKAKNLHRTNQDVAIGVAKLHSIEHAITTDVSGTSSMK